MKKTELNIAIQFTEPLLGSANANPKIHEEFIAAKAPTATAAAEETAAIAEDPAAAIEKQRTVFPRGTDGQLILWDYQIRGFFKEAIAVLVELGDKDNVGDLSKWSVKKSVDSFLFVGPRQINLLRDGAPILGPDEIFQRPLRADTMQGPRVCLAASEKLHAGVTVEFRVTLLDSTNAKAKGILKAPAVRAALDYGALKGFGQWRSGGYGRFTWSEQPAN